MNRTNNYKLGSPESYQFSPKHVYNDNVGVVLS